MSEQMKRTLLDLWLEGIKEERLSIPYLPEQEFYKILNLCYPDSGERIFHIAKREIATYPRTEVYKVSHDLKVPEVSNIAEVFEYQKFCRPWVLQFIPEKSGDQEAVFSHVVLEDEKLHLFLGMRYGVNNKVNISITSLEDGELISLKKENDEAQILNIMQLFHAMQSRHYVEIKEKKRPHKGKIGASRFSTATYYISLSEAGRRYQSTRLITKNTNYKDGKIQSPVSIDSFYRHQRVGKGRTETRVVRVKAFARNQWVVPVDRVTKVTA